jgi:hypothetical protein
MARKVYDCSTGSIYREASRGGPVIHKIGNEYVMPHGHCMFDRPWEYGKIACNDSGIPGFRDADQRRNTRTFIHHAMRHYWEITSRPHTWSEIYPGPCDTRAAAIAISRTMADRGMRF